MGTFHDDLGALHGITVVVETTGPETIVGRCHEANDQRVLLLDADVHAEGRSDLTKQQWLERAAKWGVFAAEPTLEVPRANVTSITPLGEIEKEGGRS